MPWALAAGLGAAMVAGTWASRRLVERLAPARFQLFVAVLLAVVAAQMVIFG